jgi:hypothetical protein
LSSNIDRNDHYPSGWNGGGMFLIGGRNHLQNYKNFSIFASFFNVSTY